MLKILLLLSCFLTNAYAEDFKTNFLTFNVAYRNIDITHQEQSSATNFVSLGEKSSIPVFSLQAGLEKEFMADLPVSFTAGVGGGALLGRRTKDLVTRDLQFRDGANGTFYSLGATLNGNFKWNKMRTQLFGGFHFVKTEMDYKLKITKLDTSPPQRNIDYSEEATQSYLTAGVRIFDSLNEIFSIISLEYQVASSFTMQNTASKIDGATITMSNPASVEHAPLVLNLGFGIQF